MYINDDKIVFPTRFGDATGKANERKMLDLVSGPNGIRKHYRTDSDGVTTRLKTHAGMPRFINDKQESAAEETALMPFMDSGSIDLTSILEPTATLRYADSQRAAVSAEELIGKIKPPSIETVGNPPVEGEDAKSCSGSRADKLTCMALCPASLFTGKTKLYVQALYGSGDSWQWEVDGVAETVPYLVHSNGTILDTNTGVYRSDDNTHWLIRCAGDGVLVTKLTAGKEVKKLVSLLSDTGISSLVKDRIEAYILAYSSPSPSMVFARTLSLPSPFMLGYGWKFNWGGSKADIIEHSEGSPRHTSSHYRLTISRNMSAGISTESNRWSFALGLVEGPVSWHNTQYAQAIASPDWSTNLLYIFGTLYGGQYGSNAPVYCFYKENDELEIFRYSTSGGEGGVMYMVTSEPAQWMWPVDWTTENLLIYTWFGSVGLEGAEGERRVRTATPTISGFSCGQASSVSSEQSYEFDRYTLSSKTFVGDGSTWVSTNVGFNAYEQNRFARDTGWGPWYVTGDGKQRYNSGVALIHEDGEYLGYASGSDNFMSTLGYSRYYYDGTHVETLKTALIIPFHDAEAAYMWGNLNTVETATVTGGYCEGTNQPGFFCNRARYVFSDGSGGYTYYYYFEYAGGDGTHLGANNDPNTDLNDTNDTLIVSKIVTRSGAYEFSPETSMVPFFAGTPYVTQQFSTVSSVNALLYGQGVQYVPGVNLVNFLLRPTFVGWA